MSGRTTCRDKNLLDLHISPCCIAVSREDESEAGEDDEDDDEDDAPEPELRPIFERSASGKSAKSSKSLKSSRGSGGGSSSAGGKSSEGGSSDQVLKKYFFCCFLVFRSKFHYSL